MKQNQKCGGEVLAPEIPRGLRGILERDKRGSKRIKRDSKFIESDKLKLKRVEEGPVTWDSKILRRDIIKKSRQSLFNNNDLIRI